MTTYITINKHVIAANAKHGGDEPPIRISKGKSGKPVYANRVKINGPSEIIYDPAQPILKCGARVVIATEADVEVVE